MNGTRILIEVENMNIYNSSGKSYIIAPQVSFRLKIVKEIRH
jgi:hypothetical protein